MKLISLFLLVIILSMVQNAQSEWINIIKNGNFDNTVNGIAKYWNVKDLFSNGTFICSVKNSTLCPGVKTNSSGAYSGDWFLWFRKINPEGALLTASQDITDWKGTSGHFSFYVQTNSLIVNQQCNAAIIIKLGWAWKQYSLKELITNGSDEYKQITFVIDPALDKRDDVDVNSELQLTIGAIITNDCPFGVEFSIDEINLYINNTDNSPSSNNNNILQFLKHYWWIIVCAVGFLIFCIALIYTIIKICKNKRCMQYHKVMNY